MGALPQISHGTARQIPGSAGATPRTMRRERRGSQSGSNEYARQDNFESPCMNIHQRMTRKNDSAVMQPFRSVTCGRNYSKLY